MLFIVAVYTLCLFQLGLGRTWEDILLSDVTCCNSVSDQEECEETYGGSGCIWLEWGISDGVDNIITQSGSQCVGTEYYFCRLESEGCCAPGCEGVTTPDPAAAPAAEPTPNPTRACTKSTAWPNCVLGGNYAFEGVPCQISGDPHTKTFNGGSHDFQGQPLEYNDDGEQLNQYYYIAPCSGSSSVDIPFAVLGTHYNFGDRITTGLDYLTLELYGSKMSTSPGYYLFLSSAIAAYADTDRDGVSTDYDDTLSAAENALNSISGSVSIGRRFVANVSSNGWTTSLSLQIDGAYAVTVYMKAQGALVETDGGDERHRMHYVYIEQDAEYKCASCGLCGNFKDEYNESATTQSMEICDGSSAEYGTGIDDATLENFDLFGWTFERNFWNKQCSNYSDADSTMDYDLTENLGTFNWSNPCDPRIQNTVDGQCAVARASQTRCCSTLSDQCDALQSDCETDVCIMSTVNGVGNKSLVAGYVNETLAAALSELCSIPGVDDAFTAATLIDYESVGCWKDDEENRAMNFSKQNLETVAECIEKCYDNDFVFAAVINASRVFRCFCTNDEAAYQQYGASTLCEDGVGGELIIQKRNNRTVLEAMDVYKITSSSDAAQLILSAHAVDESAFAVLLRGESGHLGASSRWTLSMVLAGGALTVCGAALLRRCKNTKYAPISGGSPRASRMTYV